jgi:hypothetical protein
LARKIAKTKNRKNEKSQKRKSAKTKNRKNEKLQNRKNKKSQKRKIAKTKNRKKILHMYIHWTVCSDVNVGKVANAARTLHVNVLSRTIKHRKKSKKSVFRSTFTVYEKNS